MYQIQQEAQMFNALSTLFTLAVFAFTVWACFWYHAAYKRWETRDEAKLQALSSIARSLRKDSPADTKDVPSWAATR